MNLLLLSDCSVAGRSFKSSILKDLNEFYYSQRMSTSMDIEGTDLLMSIARAMTSTETDVISDITASNSQFEFIFQTIHINIISNIEKGY